MNLSNAKGVSLWHENYQKSKIVERCIFRLIICARKYVQVQETNQNKQCDNLSTRRTKN